MRRHEGRGPESRVFGDIPHLFEPPRLGPVRLTVTNLDRSVGFYQDAIGLQVHWSATHSPVPGGSCCERSWRPGAAHRYRHLWIRELP